jgi:hypothetical protein
LIPARIAISAYEPGQYAATPTPQTIFAYLALPKTKPYAGFFGCLGHV